MKTFFLFFFLGALSLVSLVSQWVSGDVEDWKLDFLDKRMNSPLMPAVCRYFIQKYKVGENQEDINRLGYLQYLQFLTPDIDGLARNRDSLVADRRDIASDLEGAKAFAYYISHEKATFDLPPNGACHIQMERGMLAYAVIHWMDEIRSDQKIGQFDASSQWNGTSWTVTISTAGDAVHESIFNGYRQVMEKKAGLDNKNNEPLDFVRTALRKLCTEFKVTHDNGSLNLVMTFTPQ